MPLSHSPRRQRNWEKIYAHHTKSGPRRYHRDGTPGVARLPTNAEERNPFTVEVQKGACFVGGERRIVHLGSVRMKNPRLRRVKRAQ